ncbi:hypothetical protein E2C01_045770 [Portunus trituberculatus]|uniref:Uncharacterized protein n=1 Tax=Portunus trituberculatus TaxID=210409 RepID=A0A5B7G3W0_PORTR|nr:hypothetical protein [Portunus trituberculatus]
MRPSEELPEQETAVGGPSGGESSSLLRPEDDVSQARGRETTYWDYNESERWLPRTGYLVPMRTSRFKKRPHMMRMFVVHDRAETPPPKRHNVMSARLRLGYRPLWEVAGLPDVPHFSSCPMCGALDSNTLKHHCLHCPEVEGVLPRGVLLVEDWVAVGGTKAL